VLYVWLARQDVLISFAGWVVLLLSICNFGAAVAYISMYRDFYEDLNVMITSMAMGEVSLSPVTFSFDSLAYYDLAVIAIDSSLASLLVLSTLWKVGVSLSAVCCK
jgi:hypothetical protein